MCFFVSVWNHSSVATTVIIKLFLLSHTVKSESQFCACPLGVCHWKQCLMAKKCDNKNFRWFPLFGLFFWLPSVTHIDHTQSFYTLAEIWSTIYLTSEGYGVIWIDLLSRIVHFIFFSIFEKWIVLEIILICIILKEFFSIVDNLKK